MARGRFGRRRTQAQSMTALIASLLREQRAAEDRAIFDAWQNGGMFKGKKVTDQMLLGYIRDRRDGFTKDDPLWDQWNNSLVQHRFTIGEQKIGLAFKQGKVGAGAVAAFYRQQLKSIPKDSAFYRDVASRAAEWAKAVGGAARSAGRARARAAVDTKMKPITDALSKWERLNAAVTQAAKREGLITGNDPVTAADATDIQDMFERGSVTLDGKPVAFQTWREAAPSAYRLWGQKIAADKKAGRAWKQQTQQRSKFLTDYVIGLNTLDDRAAYEVARDTFIEETRGVTDPYVLQQKRDEYVAALRGIGANAAKATGEERNLDEFIGGINNEISALTDGKASGPTVAELYGERGDTGATIESTLALQSDFEALESGMAYYGQDEPGGAFKVIPYPPTGLNDPFGRRGLDDSVQPAVIKEDGRPRVVMLKGRPVQAGTLRDLEGNPVDTTGMSQEEINNLIRSRTVTLDDDQPVVGFEFQIPQGEGKPPKTTWGVVTPDGSVQFTDENPFSSAAYDINGQRVIIAPPTEPDKEGNFAPDLSRALNQNIDLKDLATDTTVSSADLATALASGAIPGVDEVKAQRALEQKQAEVQRQTAERMARDKARRGIKPDPLGRLGAAAEAAGLSPLQNALTSALDAITTGLRQTTLAPDQLVPQPERKPFSTGAPVADRFTPTPTPTRMPTAPPPTPPGPKRSGGLPPRPTPTPTPKPSTGVGVVGGKKKRRATPSKPKPSQPDSFQQTGQQGSQYNVR